MHFDDRDYSQDYLTFKILSPGTITYNTYNSNTYGQYSLDNGETWSQQGNNITVNVVTGNIVLWKGSGTTTFGSVCNFRGTASFEIYGNILSILYDDDFINITDVDVQGKLVGDMFRDTKCISAKNLVLPANFVGSGMFSNMFNGCTLLTTPP